MAKVKLKTSKNDASVADFMDSVTDEAKRADCQTILEMMLKATGSDPKMWGKSIVGFGEYHFKYASGREGDWMRIGFSPRKQNITLYIMNGFTKYVDLLARLGKHKTGKGCLYINRLDDVSVDVLNELIVESIGFMDKKYPKG